jgi:hypothetical protein
MIFHPFFIHSMMMMACLFLLFTIFVVSEATNPNQILTSKLRSQFTPSHRLLQTSPSSISTPIMKLTASNGGENDFFGGSNAVAISNNRIVVSAYGYEDRSAAYLFGDPWNPQSGHDYTELAILYTSDEGTQGIFSNVAMDGDTIVVGATSASSVTGASESTLALFVYQVINNNDNYNVTVSQTATLTVENGGTYDFFGWAVAIRGNTILVSAIGGDNLSGSAYIFGNPSTDPNIPEWTQLQQLQPDDLTENDWFGFSVALDDNVALVGTGGALGDAFAVYVFAVENDDSSTSSFLSAWTQTAKLTGLAGSFFGASLAVA